jgi:hypothetical protein
MSDMRIAKPEIAGSKPSIRPESSALIERRLTWCDDASQIPLKRSAMMMARRLIKTLAFFALTTVCVPMLLGTTCANQTPTCPNTQQLVNGLCETTPTLTGLWSGTITGDVTFAQTQDPVPPNPNPFTQNEVSHQTFFEQLVFNDSGLPLALPLPVSAFGSSFNVREVTAFNIGQTQTFTSSSASDQPSGAASTEHFDSSETVTLTVTESDLSQAHFRVVYATTDSRTSNHTSASAGITCDHATTSSTGTLTIEATATDGLLNFSVEFSAMGTQTDTSGNSPCPPAVSTTTTINASNSGKLEGKLARD